MAQAFCEIDPERHYAVSKDQFANAIATACSVVAATKLLDFIMLSSLNPLEMENTWLRGLQADAWIMV